MGFKSLHTVNLLASIQSVNAQIDAIWTYENETGTWKKYLREDEYGITDLIDLVPGKAYWVVANDIVEWELGP